MTHVSSYDTAVYILSNRHEVGAEEAEKVEAELKEERKRNEAEIVRAKNRKV